MKYSAQFLDEHRNINVDYDWYECTIEWWTERLAKFGIQCDEIQFTGFCSQGDGASFTGRVRNAQRFITFMTGGTKAYPMWHKVAVERDLWITIERLDSRYRHENTITANVEPEQFTVGDNYDTDEMVYEMHKAWDRVLDDEHHQFELDCRDFVRALCRYIYRDLEQEYEYLTSDEAVAETLEANDIQEPADELC
jgi:hypothetical protein